MIKELIKNILPYGIISKIIANKSLALKKKNDLLNAELLKKKITDLLSNTNSLKLELGAGNKKGIDNWVTMDLSPECDITYDLLKPLPFPDNSVDEIYTSHFLEHFYTNDILKILKESYRILKLNGKISTCVPDGSIYIKAYANNQKLDPNQWLRYKPAATIYSDIDIVNYMAYMGENEHRHLFDQENLIAIFKAAGFINVRKKEFDKNIDMIERDYQSIYVVGEK
jgi:predicted SAM-dependent methyltransferase